MSLVWNLLRLFLSETSRPVCVAYHHFGPVTLCRQKISKSTSKTIVQKEVMSRDSLKAQKNDQNLIVLLFVYCLHLLYIHNYGSKMHTFLCPEVFVFIYAFD